MGAFLSSSTASTFNWAADPRVSTPDGVKKAKAALLAVAKSKKCSPILLRLAWHDAGTFDKVRSGGGRGEEAGRDQAGRK